LHLIAFKGYTDLLRLAYEQYHANQHLVDNHGPTLLHLAARSGHIETYNYLIALGADTKIKHEKRNSLIHYAPSGGSLQIVNAVLEGLMSLPQSGHCSPLHWACRAGNFGVVERLIEEGYRSEYVTLPRPEGQWSPMSIATFHGNGKMLEELFTSSRSLLAIGADGFRVHGKYSGYWCNECFHVSA
jgi:ankyrin repeat protein